MKVVVDTARTDAGHLAAAGFPALMVENFGDTPYHTDTVPPETVSAMTLVAHEVSQTTGLPLGINVLRNDSLAALAIASVVGAEFIRVNVLTGVMFTDQGPIVGNASVVARRRVEITPHLDGARPIDLLRAGRVSEVIAALEADESGSFA